MVKRLIEHPEINKNPMDNFEMTPYYDAMINKNFEVAEFLHENGCTIIHRELGYKLCEAGAHGKIDLLKKYYNKNFKSENKMN